MALQGWFVARIGRFLDGHGRRLIGWDEILESGIPARASIMSWRGTDGALAAARAGHDVVMAPAPTLYLDHLHRRPASSWIAWRPWPYPSRSTQTGEFV